MIKLNMNRVPIYVTIGVAVVSGLVLMPFLVKPALADDVCYSETVGGSGSTGPTPPIYQLNSDCTLHIGPVALPSRNETNPIQQHDKVKRIVFDNPKQTSLNEDSSYLFYGYPKVESIEGIDNLDVSHVIDFENAFVGLNLKEPVDLSSWDTKKLDNATSMFKSSNISKFVGLDKWNLNSLTLSDEMYADLNPSHPVKIQTNIPNLWSGIRMFSGSNLDMFPDINKLQLGTGCQVPNIIISNIFENSKATNLDISSWNICNSQNTEIEGMFTSPYIKFATFGNKNIDEFENFKQYTLYHWLFEKAPGQSQSMNVWDDPNLPKEYSSRKWATLPIKQECETQFNGNPDNLSDNCRDDSKSWVSTNTGTAADNELFDSGNYHRIFFRVASIPVVFNTNGVDNAQNMPILNHFDRLYTNNDDVIPNNEPEDPSGAKAFDSWNTQADGKGKTYHPGDHAGHDIQSLDLYAQWKDKAPNVQFNNNGGEGPTPETKPATDDNTKIAVDCTSTPSKDGSTFIGWSKTKNDVLEGSYAGEKGNIDVCGYSDKKIVKGLAGRTIDLYATWARKPKAVFNENRPKDMTALLPATNTITSNWTIDDSEPKTYVAPNIEGWNKGYTPDGVYRFDGWMNENGTPFTGAYLDREDITINAKWSRIAPAENHNHDNDNNDQNNHDNGNTDDNNGDTVDDNANTNASNNGADNNSNSGSDTTNNQQNSINRPGTTPIISSSGKQETDSGPLLDSSLEGSSDASAEPATGIGSESSADDTGSPSSQHADTSEGNNLAKTGAGIITPIVLIIVSIVGATAAIVFSRTRSRKQQ